MESAKINASKVSQMTKHFQIGINGTTGNDLTLDSNGDGSLNILLPEGAIVTAVHVGGSFTNGSGTSQLQAPPAFAYRSAYPGAYPCLSPVT